MRELFRRRDYAAATRGPLPPAPRVGVDTSGATVIVALVASDGSWTTHQGGPVGRGTTAYVASIVDAVAGLRDAAGAPMRDLAEMAGVGGVTIGIGAPGHVKAGVVSHAVRLGIERLDLAGALERAWGMRPHIASDADAAAVGAHSLLDGEPDSLALLRLGDDVAAGFVLDGRVWAGSRGAAGQLSQVALAQGQAEAATQIADAVRTILLTVDVETVFITGEYARAGAPLRAAVAAALAAQPDAQSPQIAALDLPARVRWLDPDEPIAAVGAALLAHRVAARG